MYLIFNFKQNKDLKDSVKYLRGLVSFLQNYNPGTTRIVIAPPLPYLQLFEEELSNFNFVYIAAQDVSKYNGGSYTGEVSATQIKDFAKFCIIGHSERRENFNESIEDINLKIDNCISNALVPIVCFSNLEQLTGISNLEKVLLAYEPIDFIGGSKAISKDSLADFYKSTGLTKKIIYGGSINEENILRFVSINFVSGLLVGGSSLDIDKAISMLELLK